MIFSAAKELFILATSCLLFIEEPKAAANHASNTPLLASEFLLPAGATYRYAGAGNCGNSSSNDGNSSQTSLEYSEFYGADNECHSYEFCGTDNECHTYSCEAWYQWGSPELTGHIYGIPIDYTTGNNRAMYLVGDDAEYVEGQEQFDLPGLECAENLSPAEDQDFGFYAPSIVYGCRAVACAGDACERYSETTNAEEGLAVDFRRRCEAKKIGNRYDYFCRDNGDPGAISGTETNTLNVQLDEDYDRIDQFLRAVEHGLVNCSDEHEADFIYSLWLKSDVGSATWAGTSEYNETYAAASMNSKLQHVGSSGSSDGRSDSTRFASTGQIAFALMMALCL